MTTFCHSYLKRFKAKTNGIQTHVWRVADLCNSYAWPAGLAGGGVIGILEMGGGWTQSDVNAFCAANGVPLPSITDVSVDGTTNSKQKPRNDADYEVMLDIETAITSYFVATGKAATVRIYWTQDMASTITKAAADGCSVFSISWGADEAEWGNAAGQALEEAAEAATAAGMTILAAAGDNDSSDGGQTPANVDLPGSAPHVLSCGGTNRLPGKPEVVWNNNPGNPDGEGTGGGFSTLFPVQLYQIGAPAAPKGLGRMVPDVAACADPNTGYETVVYGTVAIVGGTSCVAPLLAGLIAACGIRLGFVNTTLWKNQQAFHDIVNGNNGTYSAKHGPDACSGIGRPVGVDVAALFKAA